jgi:hypothetical protein
MTIRLHCMQTTARGKHVEAETVAEALEHFNADSKWIFCRGLSDEELLDMENAIFQRNDATAKFATGPFWAWQSVRIDIDGDGWRTIWAQNQATVQQQPQGLPPGMMPVMPKAVRRQ